MSEFKATPGQELAMAARGSAILVSAGAGSGKTRVLVQRLMRYITDPENPKNIDSFLIITYTRAAAGELRGRIMEELAKAIAKDPSNTRLRRQNALVAGAKIGTIHSFCAGVIRDNCQILGLAPDFKIIDDERGASMKASALERVLEDWYAKEEEHPGFAELVINAGGGRDDTALEELVLELHSKMQSHARPDLWAGEQIEALSRDYADAGETLWGKSILENAKINAEYYVQELRAIREELSDEAFKSYNEKLEVSIRGLENLCEALNSGWDAARNCLPIEFPRALFPRGDKNPDPELTERMKARRDECKDGVRKLEKRFSNSSETILKDLRSTAPAMTALLQLTLDFDRAFAKEKRRASVADYSDLEHFAARMLTEEDGSPTELARSIAEGFTEIMVDEYQDVSEVQDTIFSAVSRAGKNLFMVGDIKQSIYRFRLADPGIFGAKLRNYAPAKEAYEELPRKIMMQDNFRSRHEIIDCVNAVFSETMSEELGEVSYDEDAALHAGAPYTGEVPVPELVMIWQTPENAEYAEAVYVANRIRSMMAEGLLVGKGDEARPLEYGDIAVLLHAANVRGNVYSSVFAEYGIPVSEGRGAGFFLSSEICAVMAFLSITDNPHRDIPLTTALSSPVCGFTPEELAVIRAADKNRDFYTALLRFTDTEEPENEALRGKTAAFLRLLGELRTAAPDTELAELIRIIYDRTDMPAVYSAMFDGARRRDNLMLMPQLVSRFLATGQTGLHHFVLWLERMAEKRTPVSSGSAESSAVQIMTIHKSKGLEYPVVFLSDTARSFNTTEKRELITVHKKLGLGPFVVDPVHRAKYPSIARIAIDEALTRESLSEEMRLLYVAMTRPEERLIITASYKDPDKVYYEKELTAGGMSKLDPALLAGENNHAAWLLYAGIRDRFRHMKLVKVDSATLEAAENHSTAAETSEEAGNPLGLKAALEFQYPYAEAEELPSKLTATELKGRSPDDEDSEKLMVEEPKSPVPGHSRFRTPDFAAAGKPLTGAARGTATHVVLQNIDLKKVGSEAEISEEIERLRKARFLTDREAEAVEPSLVRRLFESPVGQRMLSAEEIYREFRFTLLCDAEELTGSGGDEKILLQGVIDCLVVENGLISIIDYKTDYVGTKELLRERTEYYTGQLNTYAQAAERIFRLPVREKLLYFVRNGLISEIL